MSTPSPNRAEYLREYHKEYQAKKKRPRLTFDPDEYKLFKESAKKNNLRISEQIKKSALADIRQEPIIPADVQTKLDEANFLLRNIGNNINQIAHAQNLEALKDDFAPSSLEAIALLKSIFEGLKATHKQIEKITAPPNPSPP